MGADPVTGALIAASSALNFFGAREQADAQQDALNSARTELQPFNIFTPGGGFAGFGDVVRDQPANQTNFSFADLANNNLGNPVSTGQGFTTPSAAPPLGFLPPQTGGPVTAGTPQTGGGVSVPGAPPALASSVSGLGGFAGLGNLVGPNGIPGLRDLAFPDGFLDSFQNVIQTSNQNVPGTPLNVANLPATVNNIPSISGQDIVIGLGDLDPARGGLVQLANQQIGRAGLGGGLPTSVQNASGLAQLANAIPQGNFGGAEGGLQFNELLNNFNLARTQDQFADLSQNGFQADFINTAFNNANAQVGDIGSGDAARAQTLEALRAQALPAQQRAVDSTLTNLFGSGRLGTTGGANVIGRLAESQNQQDLGFQLAANQEGRASQQNAANLAGQLTNIGQGTAGLSESLLQNAFGRFNTTQELASDLNNQRFQRGLLTSQFNREGSQQNLGNAVTLASLGQQLQQGDLNLALQALQGQSGLQSQGLENFGAALGAAQAQANARIGAGSNISALASNPNFGQSGLSGLGNALLTVGAQRAGPNGLFGSK